MSRPFRLSRQHVSTGHQGAVYALVSAFTPFAFFSAAGDRWIVEWNSHHPENGILVAVTETQVYSLATLPGEGRRVVAGNMNGGLHWLDLDRPDQERNIQHHQKGVFDLLVAGDRLFSAGGEGMLSCWDTATARALESLHLSNRSLRVLAHSPARRELAVGASDGCIYLLDTDTLALRHTIPGAHDPSVFALCYHPVLPLLLSGGRDAWLRVWTLPSVGASESAPTLFIEHPAHLFTVNAIVFSPDGRYFATGSRDKTLKIWNGTDFQLVKVADTIRDGGHVNSVNCLLWHSDFLLSAGDDKTIRWWKSDV